jgi:hypothetical protein
MAELGDAAMLLQAAIDALCEPDEPVNDEERWKRWQPASNGLKVWAEIRSDWTSSQRELEVIKTQLRRVRHIATHGSDSFLLNMGYPEDFERRMAQGSRWPARTSPRASSVLTCQCSIAPSGLQFRSWSRTPSRTGGTMSPSRPGLGPTHLAPLSARLYERGRRFFRRFLRKKLRT